MTTLITVIYLCCHLQEQVWLFIHLEYIWIPPLAIYRSIADALRDRHAAMDYDRSDADRWEVSDE